MALRLFCLTLFFLNSTRVYGGDPWVRHEFAQVAAGKGIRSIILVLNHHPVDVKATVEFFADDGSPLKFTIDGVAASTSEITVAPGGTRRILVTHSGTTQAGWCRLTATRTVGAQLLFELFSGEELLTQAAVEAVSPVNIALLFVESVEGKTGVALANVSDVGSIRVGFTLRDKDGNVLATFHRKVGERGHLAKFLFELFPDFPNIQGSLEIVSTGRIALVTLQQTGLVLGTLPVITPPPIKGLFQ